MSFPASPIMKIPAFMLVFTMTAYYYLYFLSPDLTRYLPLLAIGGMSFMGFIMIGLIARGSVARWVLVYIASILAMLACSVVLQWPNIAWLLITSSALLVLNRREFVKVFFYSSLIFFLLVVVLAILGYLPMIYIGFDGMESERYGAVKYTLGFDGPNQTALSFFSVLLSGMYLYGNSRLFTLTALVVSLFIGLSTGSRTGLVVAILLILTYRILSRKKIERGRRARFTKYAFPVLFVISCALSLQLAKSPYIDEMLSGRPGLISSYLTDTSYTPSLLGTDRVYNKAQYQTPPLDNFFIYIYARYGVIAFLVISCVLWMGLKKERSARIHVLIVFVFIYGMFEAFFEIPAKNFILPMLIISIFKKGDRNVKRLSS